MMSIREKKSSKKKYFYVFLFSIILISSAYYYYSKYIRASIPSKQVLYPLVIPPEQFVDSAPTLQKVISLVLETNTGTELKSFIDDLLYQDKIHLTDLDAGHYGESGEGCVVKEGSYYYEGFFIHLSNKLSLEEMAISLVHEVTHYRMLQDNSDSDSEFQRKVAFLEISAFATQYQFIEELEKIGLLDSKKMFIEDAQIVSEIMHLSYEYKKTALQQIYQAVFNQLVIFGYSSEELNRFVSQRSAKECAGFVEPSYISL